MNLLIYTTADLQTLKFVKLVQQMQTCRVNTTICIVMPLVLLRDYQSTNQAKLAISIEAKL